MASQSDPKKKKRSLEYDSSSEEEIETWPHFVVVEGGKDGGAPLKLNPFAVDKGLKGVAGTVKNVTRLRSGFLLVECNTKQQSKNLTSISSFAGVDVKVSPHKFLNSRALSETGQGYWPT